MSIFKYIAQIATFIGANTEAAPVDDTTPSGLNGRLQRIAQNLTSVINSNNDTKDKLDTANTKIDALITAQNATNTKLDTMIAALNTANGLLIDIKNKP